MSRAQFRRSAAHGVLAMGIVIAALGMPNAAGAQPRLGGDPAAVISVPIYDRANPNRVIALLSGTPAQTTGSMPFSARQPLTSVRVEYYDENGQTNLVIRGTNCVYDARARTAQSAETLHVATGDGRLELEGDGFTWWQTNNDLVISNRVRTTVRRPAAAGGATNLLAGQDLRVFADRFRFNYQTNRIQYEGHVRVEDARIELTCQRLTILRGASGRIDRLLADEEVVIRDRLTGGRTTGQAASYQVDGSRETVELTGNPHYQEGVREATAERFVLDRTENALQAIGEARLVFPVGTQGAPTLLAMPGTAPMAAGGDTNQLVEVTAARVTILLPATNGPVRGVIAETNVVLRDPQQTSQATAQRAEYGADGRLELTGEPVCRSGDRLMTGGAILFEPAPQVLRVSDGAFVRLPRQALVRPLAALAGQVERTNVLAGTNQAVEIRSRELTYRDGWLRFVGDVRAEALEGARKLGDLQCAELGVQYSNRVQQVRGSGSVRLDETPLERADGSTRSRQARCETLTFLFDAAGQLDRLEADGDIEGRETATGPPGRAPVVRRLQCQVLRAQFRGASNIVDRATAERGVVLSQDDRAAQANRAVYTGTNSLLSLEGQPIVVLPEGRITEAETITWNRVTGKYRILGPFKSRWKSLFLGTNATRLLGKP